MRAKKTIVLCIYQTIPASFSKDERLHSFKEIQSLMKGGETFFHYPFKVVCQNIPLEGEDDMRPNAIIVSVPKGTSSVP